jgi:hypothetical protein
MIENPSQNFKSTLFSEHSAKLLNLEFTSSWQVCAYTIHKYKNHNYVCAIYVYIVYTRV